MGVIKKMASGFLCLYILFLTEADYPIPRNGGKWICLKPRPNDSNTATQHIPTLLVQQLQAPAKRSQHLNATDRNIVERNMLRAFGHTVATCCNMLRVENQTSAHAQAHHCFTDLAKRLQHHATSTNVAWNIWPFSNLSRQHPTCRNMSQQVATWWPSALNMLRPTMFDRGLRCKSYWQSVRARWLDIVGQVLFLRVFGPRGGSRSFNSQKKKEANMQPSWANKLDQNSKGFSMRKKNATFFRDTTGNPERLFG